MYITKDEILALAAMSRLHIDQEEIPALIRQIQDLLTYAERVKEIQQSIQITEPLTKNINVFREDSAQDDDAPLLMNQAPARVENFFVVPVIIDSK